MFDNALAEPIVDSSPLEHSPVEPEHTTLRVRNSPSKSTLAKSSIRTSVFSKATNGTSLNSKSSYETTRPATASSEVPAPKNEYSRIIDALDMEIDSHKCKEGCDICASTMRGFSVASIAPVNVKKHARHASVQDGRRVVSLPVVRELRLGDADNDSAAVIAAVNGVNNHRSPERMRRILGVPNTPERIEREINSMLEFMETEVIAQDSEEVKEVAQPSIPLPEVEDTEELEDLPPVIIIEGSSPPSELVHEGEDDVFVELDQEVEEEDWTLTSGMIREAGRRHRWSSKFKSIPKKLERAPKKVQQQLEKVPKKAKQAVKDVKHFGKTVKGFVPALVGRKKVHEMLKRIV
jgi:hypothetical protein